MAIRKKIDSNETGGAFAEEVLGEPGVLPPVPKWYATEPNKYDDFGGELTLLARRFIEPSRQRRKGVISDLDASGGFNQDLTDANTQRLLTGFMYADYREKLNTGANSVTATGYVVDDETLYTPGMLVFATDFTSTLNNGLKQVVSVDAGTSEVRVGGSFAEAAPADARLIVVGYQSGAGEFTITTAGNFATLNSTGIDFTTLGLTVGELIFIGGDSAATRFISSANNGFKRVSSIAPDKLVFDKSSVAMVDEITTTETVRIFFGRVLKNETGNLIVRRSWQLERQLGAPDTASPSAYQAEYLVGAFGNELTVNIEQADKVNVDYSFVAMDHDQRTTTDGLKGGDRVSITEADAYNTSSDFNTIRLALWTGADEAPAPLFAHLLDLTLTINNNVSVNKAVAVLGGFDVTLGLFEVSVEATAYFSTIEAVQAIRRNKDTTLHAAMAKNNAGWAIDLPLVALGDGRLEIELDEPVTLPLKIDAATAVKINPNLDHTLLWCFYPYLPSLAET